MHPLQRTAGTLLLASLLAAAVSAEPAGTLAPKDARTSLEQPNGLLAVDLFHDPTPEIVATDTRGRIRVFNPLNGDRIEGREFQIKPESSLTAAVAGDFRGSGTMDLAVATGDGRVIIYDGSTMEQVASRTLTQDAVTVSPTVVPMPESAGSTRDGLVLMDNSGAIYGIVLNKAGGLAEAWPRIPTNDKASAPAAVGAVREAGQLDVVFTTRDGDIIIVHPADGSSDRYKIKEHQVIITTPLLVDVDGDGRCEVIFFLEKGVGFCMGLEGGKFLPRWKDDAGNLGVQRATSDPVIVAAPDTPPGRGRLVIASDAALHVLDPATGELIRKEEKGYAGICTQLTPLNRATGYPLLAMGIGQSLRVVDTTPWFRGEKLGTPSDQNFDRPIANSIVCALVRGDQKGEPEPRLVSMDPKGTVHFISWRFQPPDVPGALWMCRGGTPWHNAIHDTDYFKREQDRVTALNAVCKNYEQQVAGPDLGKALAAAHWLCEFDPLSEQYASSLRRLWIRKNLPYIGLSALAILLTGGYLAFKIAQFVTRRTLAQRARALMARGRLDEARRLYERLYQRLGKEPKVVSALAGVYMAQKDYSPETAGIFGIAHSQDPTNRALLHALARAFEKGGRTDPEAEAVYVQALADFPDPPLLEFAIGRCLMAQSRFEEAGKRFRAALRGGLVADHVYSALCDVYMATRNFSAKALPAFQQQFNKRADDQKFLEGYLQCCMDTRQTDSTTESLCHQVLDGNPAFLPAYVHLASIHLQKGEVGRAVEEVRKALAHDPENTQAVALLGHCYLLQNRTDDDAYSILKRALKVNPGDRELLQRLTEICFQRNRFDQEAVEIYHRSLEENPTDTTTLKALAQVAQLTGNVGLTIRSIEVLLQQGQSNPELNKRLARAYARANMLEPKAERVYREALRQEPNSSEFLGPLANVLVLQDRQDADAIPIYEAWVKLQRDDLKVGTQLAKAYVHTNRYDAGLAMAQYFLAKAPDSEDLQRVIALASLYGNKIDEAIAEFERILARNPDDREARINLALAFSQMGRVDEGSLRAIQKALTLDPSRETLHLGLARCWLSRGEAMKAVEAYHGALKARPGVEEAVIHHALAQLAEHPDATRVRWFLCEVLVAYGRLREAMEQLNTIFETNPNQVQNVLQALDKILLKDPKNVVALAQKGRLRLAAEDFKGARQALEEAHVLQPSSQEVMASLVRTYEKTLERGEDVEVRFRLGRLFYLSQEYDKAIGCFQKTAQDYRWEAESTKMLGKCFTAKGMLDIALQEFKKLVVDEETKELLYDLAQRYEGKKDLVGAKTVYRQLFAADIDYRDVKTRFEMLSGSTSDPMAFEKTSVVQQMSESARRRYELLDELGRGAMGIVYRARDKELDEVVALKILPDNMSNNPEAVHRFKIEARNARRLSHPNIVRIHDIGEEMGRKYISMEYVDGSDLKRKVKSGGKFTMPEIYRYGMAIADALGYAHRLGIVHRDIKPANIMLNSADDVKITDFGIAKLLDQTGEGTMMGAVIGTPLYMSPEQVQGIPVDNRADIYSFGIMMYEFINGRPPFTEGDLAYQHLHKEPARPDGCPDPLWAVIKKCLEKEKTNRWGTAEMIYDALKEAKRTMGV